MKNRCANYDKEIECCKVFSDWSEAMPALQPCIESPCKYFKPYTNYDRIKSMSVEEMADKIYLSKCNCCKLLEEANIPHPWHCSMSCTKYIKQWLLQEVSEDE